VSTQFCTQLAVPSEHSSISENEESMTVKCIFSILKLKVELTCAAEIVVCQEVSLVTGTEIGSCRVGAIVLTEMSS